jgi:hypothetical protein
MLVGACHVEVGASKVALVAVIGFKDRAAAAALSDGGGFSDVKAEIIITGKGE